MDNAIIIINSAQFLQQIIDDCAKKFKSISAESWSVKPFTNKWSKQEILGHLCDSAMNNIRRFVVSQYEENNVIVYRQDDWIAVQDYQSENYQNIISLWKLLNEQIIRIIKKIPREKLNNTCKTPDEHSIIWLIEDYIKHLNHHLNQILN
ncbi:MAG TPA: DinB family protein [Parafilimonas sp.]